VIVVVIVACEVGFWVVLVAGLLTRYGLGWPRTSSALLLCAPLVDLVLLAATVADLRGGAVASAAHGLAAAYLGFSVAFGHRTIQALDQRVAHRFAGAPAPSSLPAAGPCGSGTSGSSGAGPPWAGPWPARCSSQRSVWSATPAGPPSSAPG